MGQSVSSAQIVLGRQVLKVQIQKQTRGGAGLTGGSRIPGPGYGAQGWEMVCQQFQETLGLGLYRVDGPRIPFPQRQPQRGFSPVQGARLGVRDRPRQCSSVGSAVRRSQPRDRVQLCQPGRSLPTFFPRGGVLRGQRGPQAILLPHQSFAYSSTKSCNCGQGSPWPLPGRRRTRFVQPSWALDGGPASKRSSLTISWPLW